MKSALQQAIERIEHYRKTSNYAIYGVACDDAIGVLESLLPTERQQIEQAFYDGIGTTIAPPDYFTQTYEQ